MVRFGLIDVAEQIGTSSGEFARDVASQVGGVVCNIWRDAPGLFVQNPALGFGKGMMDSLCGGQQGFPPQPVSPQPAFQGGQCCGTTYQVAFTETDLATNQSVQFVRTVTGQVGGGFFLGETNPPIEGVAVWTLPVTACDGTRLDILGGSGPIDSMMELRYTIDSVVPVAGANDCGNPSPTYSPPTTTYPPSSAPSDITVFSPGIEGGLTLPIVYAPIGVDFNINPRIEIDVGGINVTIQPDGVDVEFPTDSDAPRVLEPDFDEVLDNQTELLLCLQELKADIEELRALQSPDCVCPTNPADASVARIGAGAGSSIELAGLSNLLWVEVVLTTLPNLGKTQFGGVAPNVYYAGWFTYTVNGCLQPRQPVHFTKNIWFNAAGANGFACTLTNGAFGAFAYYVKQEVVSE